VEATIECRPGYAYSVSVGMFSSKQVDWLRSVLAYVNNGEVNRKDFSFEEYISVELSFTAMKKLMTHPDFAKWAGKQLVKVIESLMVRRTEMIRQPASFFSSERMFEQPVFQAYWTSREMFLSY